MGMPTYMWFNEKAHVVLRGAKVKVVRRSDRTDGVTVEMTEDRGAWRRGEHVGAKTWELTDREPGTKGAR